MDKQKYDIKSIGAIGCWIIILPFFFFLGHFSGSGKSDYLTRLGQMGDFMNFWVSIASLLMLSTLTYLIHQRETERAELKDRPSIVFFVDVANLKWGMRNVGNGVAYNIRFGYSQCADGWTNYVKMYSLGIGGEYVFNRALQPFRLAVTYRDLEDNLYSSFCQEDETTVSKGVNIFENENLPKIERLDEFEKGKVREGLQTTSDIPRPTPTPTPTPTTPMITTTIGPK